MCKGDDPACVDFEKHRLDFHTGAAKERRAFLKSGFAATSAAAALTTTGISLVSPALAQTSAARQPGQPGYFHLPANADTVHWGYFSKTLKPQVEVNSGDYVTVETLTHQASDDSERMITGDPGAESVYLWTKEEGRHAPRRRHGRRRGTGRPHLHRPRRGAWR